MNYFYIFLYLILLAVVAYHYWLGPLLKRRRAARQPVSTLLSLMETAGGRIQRVESAEGNVYNYEYQDGFFRLTEERKGDISVVFPAFFSVDRGELDAVRNLVNRASQLYESWNFFYTFNEQKNEIVVSLATRLTLAERGNSDAIFRETLRGCFALRHQFVSTYQREEQEETDEQTFNAMRDKFLLYMREYESQPREHRQTLAGRSLDAVLRIAGEHDLIAPQTLYIYGETTEVLKDKDAILQYDLADAIIERDEAGQPRFARQHAVLSLGYLQLQNNEDSGEARFLIALEALTADKGTLFFRATLSRPAYRSTGRLSLTEETNEDFIASFLFAVDSGTLASQEAEFNFMWNDARDKAAEHQFDALSEPQRLLLSVDSQPLARVLYWGRKLSLSDRYVEAIVLLEHAFVLLEERSEMWKANERETFFEVIYHLSFCYNALGNHAMAYFYSSGLQNLRNTRYQQEFVNTLVNRQDYRALYYIDRLLRRLSQDEEDNEQMDGDATIERHRGFLYRRRLQTLINTRLWDEAEQFGKRLLSRDDCRSFAEGQLAELHHLRTLEATERTIDDLDAVRLKEDNTAERPDDEEMI